MHFVLIKMRFRSFSFFSRCDLLCEIYKWLISCSCMDDLWWFLFSIILCVVLFQMAKLYIFLYITPYITLWFSKFHYDHSSFRIFHYHRWTTVLRRTSALIHDTHWPRESEGLSRKCDFRLIHSSIFLSVSNVITHWPGSVG